MKKSEFVERVAQCCGISKVQAETFINGFTEVLAESIKEAKGTDDKIRVGNIGQFKVV